MKDGVSTDAPAEPQDLGNELGQHLRREPALVLTVVSLGAAAFGLWASYWYYRAFGFQIIDYMQVGDFLIGWLRDPVYIGLVAIAVAAGWLLTWKDRFWHYQPQRVRVLRSRHRWARFVFRADRPADFDPLGPVTGMLLSIVTFALVLILWHDGQTTDRIKAGEGERIQITRNGSGLPDRQQPILLGVVNSWIFVYWSERGQAEAIPQSALTRIVYPARGAQRVEPVAPPSPARD